MDELSRRGHAGQRIRLAAVAALAVALAGSGCSSSGDTGPSSPPPQLWSISGTVSGDVTAGVTVKVQGRAWSAKTDANGRYTLRDVVDGTYTVEASLDGYTFSPATRSVSVSGAGVTGQDFVAALSIGITGTVSGDAGAGVTVTLSGPSPATTTSNVITDESGRYAFVDLANGLYTVTPSLAGGYTFTPANSLVRVSGVTVSGPDFVAVAMPHAISGRVTGAATAGVLVALSGAADAVAMTDGSGNFAFTGLRDGSYTVTPSLTGKVFAPASQDVTLAGANVRAPDFVAGNTHRIAGTITGDAIAGVTVTLSGAAAAAAVTDGGGLYALADLADGSYVLTPSLEGYTFSPASRPVTLAGANVTAAAFVATRIPTWSIRGTVSGTRPAGVTLTLLGATTAETVTDGAGAYAFTGLLDGSYMVIPSLDSHVFAPASRTVTVVGGNVASQDFAETLNPASPTITGTIAGEVTTGVTVTLTGISPVTAATTATSDSAGTFVFADMQDGIYLAAPSLAGYTFFPADSYVTVSGLNVVGPDFTATAIPHAISGRVTGAVTAGVTITLSGAADDVTTTDASGNYAFAALPNGSYTVTPELGGYVFAPESISVTLQGADATVGDLVAHATHSISGAISGAATGGVKVTLSGAADAEVTTDGAGRYQFPNLPDGDYVVTPSLDGYSFAPPGQAITLAGGDATANFVATTHSIRGTVTGVVQAGVTVRLAGAATAETTTDAGGAYSFPAVGNGSYMVIPALDGYAFTPASRTFRIDGADVAAQDFTSRLAP